MATNRTVVACPPSAVFGVLSDPRTYDEFVVGTKRIRRFEPNWPEVGSVFHHTLGAGPFVVRDLSSVMEVDEERRLVLRAQMGPFTVNKVAFTLRPTEGGTEVEIVEYPIEGPAAAVWNRALDGLMWLRNQELLRRLRRKALRRLEQQSGSHRR